jgi:hypothetical protein
MQQFVRIMAVALAAGFLATACGGGSDDDRKAATRRADAAAATDESAPADAAPRTAKATNSGEAHLAAAVADTKTTAPVDVLYDLPAKPEVGEPFALEIVAKPRLPADALDIEIGDSPGIAIEGERATRFMDVAAGQPYRYTVQARGDAAGLYYVTVNAKLSTQVQTESRAFSIPVVIGNPLGTQPGAAQEGAATPPAQAPPAQ